MPPTTQIRIRRDTAANFTSADPTLALGEIAYETDTRNLKVGDGATAWTALPYINPYRAGTAAAPTSNTVMGSGAGAALQAGATNNVIIGASAGDAITTAGSNVAVGQNALTSLQTGAGNNTAVGQSSLLLCSIGVGNTAIGTGSLVLHNGDWAVAVGRDAAYLNTANDTVAIGSNALDANTSGARNTAVGRDALGSNVTNNDCTAVGWNALALSIANNATAFGSGALDALTTGTFNTAVGADALTTISTGVESTAVGYRALRLATGNENTAIGASALAAVGTGATNTGIGSAAGASITTGNNNTVVGQATLNSVTTGTSNTAIGAASLVYAGTSSASNVALGHNAGTQTNAGGNNTGVNTGNIYVGQDTRTSATGSSNEIVIGYQGRGNGSNTTTIGNSSTTGTFIPGGNLTLTNGNFIVGTSGKGIDFSATANSSGTMTSELLNDYEEGTWTPAYVSSGGSFATMAMSVNAALYTKVGRQVTVTAQFATNNVDATGASGTVRISGLPFTIGGSGRTSGSVSAVANFAGDSPLTVAGVNGETLIRLFYRTAANTADIGLEVADLTTGATVNQNNIYVCMTYVT